VAESHSILDAADCTVPGFFAGRSLPNMTQRFADGGIAGDAGFSGSASSADPLVGQRLSFGLMANLAEHWFIAGGALPCVAEGSTFCHTTKLAGFWRITGCVVPCVTATATAERRDAGQNQCQNANGFSHFLDLFL
jgi:hypothetical protein